MTDIQVLYLFLFGATAGLYIMDHLLQATWSKFYFAHGLVVFSRRYQASPASSWPLDTHELETEFRGAGVYAISFRSIEDDVYAFREKFIQVRFIDFTFILHGTLRWDYDNRYVEINGMLDWYVVPLLLILLVFLIPLRIEPGALAFITGVVIVIAAIVLPVQIKIFNDIGKYAAKRWSDIRTAYGVDA